MLEVLQFIFSSFWHWLGFYIGGGWFLFIVLSGVANVVDAWK